MRWGTALAAVLYACIYASSSSIAGAEAPWTSLLAVSDMSADAPDSLSTPVESAADSAGFTAAESGSAGPGEDSLRADLGARDGGRAGELMAETSLRFKTELAAYKSLWELLASCPEVRWNGGSGAMGGTEAMSIRGRLMRRPSLMLGGAPLGQDLNVATPANLDGARILEDISLHEEVFMNGAEGIETLSGACEGEPRQGYLSLSRGGFASRFSALNYTQCGGAWRFGLNVDGASYGGAASYDAYTRDGAAVSGERVSDSGTSLGFRATRFRSRLIRYTADKTKTRLGSIAVSARREARRGLAWRTRTYYLGSEYSYMDVGPQSEDDYWGAGCAVDLWPDGTAGTHRVSFAIQRESLERSFRPFAIPEDLEGYGPPEQGVRRSVDATGAYVIGLGWGASRLTGLARVDRKELFGWSPTFAAGFARALGGWGSATVEGERSTFMPGFLEIYGPRDETARPTWYMARRIDPEKEWSLSVKLAMTRGKWTVSAAGFGVLREHILAPPAEWLGLNGGVLPTVTLPIEDAGSGSAAGMWASVEWAQSPWLRAGGSYSSQRSRVEGLTAPFQPSHKLEMWMRGEREYFGGDLRLGLMLKGTFYSSQATYLEVELPSYGVGEATGYASISDVVFFYQIKNVETRPRPSAVLDLQSGEYLLQPGPEVRVGLVWYLPG